MACKYYNFTSAQLEEHIQKYARNYLSSSEEEEFEKHLLDCEECSDSAFAEIQLFRYSRQHLTFKKLEKALNEKKWNVVFSLAKKMRSLGYSEDIFNVKEKLNLAKIGHTYENLCTANGKNDWQEVIRLGGEMEALGYDEKVHPIRDRITKAKEEIEKVTLIQIVDGVETIIGIIKDQLVKKIKPFKEYILKRGKSALLEVNIDTNLDYVLRDKEIDTHLFEDDSIKIELLIGQYENTLIIKVKALDENHKP